MVRLPPFSCCSRRDGYIGAFSCMLSMIADFFFPNMGGVENHIYQLSQHLIARGHKVSPFSAVPTAGVWCPDLLGDSRDSFIWRPSWGSISFKFSQSEQALLHVVHDIYRNDFCLWHKSFLWQVYYLPFPTVYMEGTLPLLFCTLPLIRDILIREDITIVHGHGVSAFAMVAQPLQQWWFLVLCVRDWPATNHSSVLGMWLALHYIGPPRLTFNYSPMLISYLSNIHQS